MSKDSKQNIVLTGLFVALAVGLLLYPRIADYFTPKASPVASGKVTAAKPVAAHPPTRAELLKLVNAERARNGVAPLKEDARLDKSAQMKADDEVKYHYFGHFRNGVFIGQQFIDQAGITCIYDGENITENIYVNDAKSAVQAWINSPPHHKAMINPKFTLTGFGVAGDQIVEHFCQTS